jgi:3-deoxy-7-phosphoheptulonate synthase
VALLEKNRLPPFVMVDCSHANSGKEAERQLAVAADLAGRIAAGERAVAAVMIESNLVGGAQDYRARPLAYGQSVTDDCLPWESTRPLLEQWAAAVAARRRAGS